MRPPTAIPLVTVAIAAAGVIALTSACAPQVVDPLPDPIVTTPRSGLDGSSSATSPSGTASGALDVCADLDTATIGAALGVSVSLVALPGGGCSFADPADPYAPSVTVAPASVDDYAGGFAGTRAGITSLVRGDVEDLAGVGDEAFTVVGPSPGSSSTAGAGAVLLDGVVVQVTLLQAADLTADDVRTRTGDVLAAIAEADAG